MSVNRPEGPGGTRAQRSREAPPRRRDYNSSRRKRAYSADNTLDAIDIELAEDTDQGGMATKPPNEATGHRCPHRRDT